MGFLPKMSKQVAVDADEKTESRKKLLSRVPSFRRSSKKKIKKEEKDEIDTVRQRHGRMSTSRSNKNDKRRRSRNRSRPRHGSNSRRDKRNEDVEKYNSKAASTNQGTNIVTSPEEEPKQFLCGLMTCCY